MSYVKRHGYNAYSSLVQSVLALPPQRVLNSPLIAPTRRAHGNSVPPIPNEIYFKIFSYVAPMDDGPSERESHLMCSMLTKVCRLFYVELLPRVFESVEFTFPPPGDPQWPKSIAFCRELNKAKDPLHSLQDVHDWSRNTFFFMEEFIDAALVHRYTLGPS
jgi:hypothetical protein